MHLCISWDISLTYIDCLEPFNSIIITYTNPTLLFRFYKQRYVLVNTHIFINMSVLSCLGSKSQKHVLRPESLEGTDEEDPVSALEWDLLSTDYLLGWTKY